MKFRTSAILLILLSTPLYGQSVPTVLGSIVTFCLSEKSESKDPCDFRGEVPLTLANYEVRYVPREATISEETLGKFFCAELSARNDPFLFILIAGRGNSQPSGWSLDWVNVDGLKGSLGSMNAESILSSLAGCIPKALPYVEVSMDATLGNGVGPEYDQFPRNGIPPFRSFGVITEPKERAFGFQFALEYYAESTSASRLPSGRDLWNETVEDLPYLPLAADAPTACVPLWKALLNLDPHGLVNRDQRLLPSGGTCDPKTRALDELHRSYSEVCKPFTLPRLGGSAEDGWEGCLNKTLIYRATLRHWLTRRADPSQISDVSLLVDKAIWADYGGPAGKFVSRHELQLAVGQRLAQLRPQSLQAWRLSMEAAESLAIDAREHSGGKEREQRYLQLAEMFSDRVLAFPAVAALPLLREAAWNSKSWSMQPNRLRTLMLEVHKNPADRDIADYYLAYVEKDPAEAKRLLTQLLQRSPQYRDAALALHKGVWKGLTVGSTNRPAEILRDLIR